MQSQTHPIFEEACGAHDQSRIWRLLSALVVAAIESKPAPFQLVIIDPQPLLQQEQLWRHVRANPDNGVLIKELAELLGGSKIQPQNEKAALRSQVRSVLNPGPFHEWKPHAGALSQKAGVGPPVFCI